MDESEEETSGSEPKSKKEPSGKKKFSETFEKIKKHEKVENLVEYAKQNTQDSVAYVLMIVGLFWFILQGFYGGLLIGLVAGFYFTKDLVTLFKNYDEFLKEQGLSRCLILGGTLLALFISVPSIFIGAAIMVGLKIMLRAD